MASQTTPAPKPDPAAAPPGRVEAGGALFKKVGCYQCHANEAQGGLSGPRIGPNLFPFARFSGYVRKPTGEMPPYALKVLSDQDIADIYAWVQARPRPPAVTAIPQLTP
jgi:mono/diheme cytochrome c family protein